MIFFTISAWFEIQPRGTPPLVIDTLMLVIAVRFVYRECRQYTAVFKRTQSWQAIITIWNFVDMSSQLLVVSIVLANWITPRGDYESIHILYAICSILMM